MAVVAKGESLWVLEGFAPLAIREGNGGLGTEWGLRIRVKTKETRSVLKLDDEEGCYLSHL